MNTKTLTTKQKLERKITTFTETIWKEKVQGKDVKAWLSNFEDDKDENVYNERVNALYILSKFMYFGNTEQRELLKSLFRDKVKYPLVKKIRKENQDTTNASIINRFLIEKMKKVRFLGVGNPSESGIHLLYYFRQENNLPRSLFINSVEIFSKDVNNKIVLNNPSIETYIFIDDFCGSGSQVITDGTKKVVDDIKSLNSSIEIKYISLFATEDGLTNIKNNTLFNEVDSVFRFDKTYKCFSDDSRYFNENFAEIDKNFTKEVCKKYKTKLRKGSGFHNPMGFSSSQLLVGLFHNTPNNTLPIIWYAEGNDWVPIFKRYPKNYAKNI